MREIIHKFYQSFQELDAEGMVSCYHPEVVFEDPAFGVLKGEHAGNMWKMLCKSQKGKNFSVTFTEVYADEMSGQAHWEAYYTFSKTGRKVHNQIDAKFKFKDGLIIDHRDHFDLYAWAKQAMGPVGFLMGWTTYFKRKLNSQTNTLLRKYEEKL